MDIIKQTIVP